jgi:N-acetylmuramoyl-L-alanine amidase
VSEVEVDLDGVSLGLSAYGLQRPDVAAFFQSETLAESGFTFPLDLSAAPPGPHTIDVTARSALTGATSTYSQVITVVDEPDPVGSLDLPKQDARVSPGSVVLWGWAVDRAAKVGTGVSRVVVYLDGDLLGDAIYGLDRPDVAAALGSTRFAASGYSYSLDLSSASPGQHSIIVVAETSTGAARLMRACAIYLGGGELR